MNKIILSGRWSKDIDLKYTPQGTAIAKSSIAVEDGYGDKKKTNFFDIEMWGKTAEATATYSSKGKKVLIEGRLKAEKWEKEGKTYYGFKVVADQVEFIEPKQKDATSQKEVFSDSKPIDISDENLPF
jgi:single-strand DNA-binding protein